MQAEFSTEYSRGLALVGNKGWSGSQEFPCWSGERGTDLLLCLRGFFPPHRCPSLPDLYCIPFHFVIWWSAFLKCDFCGALASVCVFFHHRSSKLAVSDADFSLLLVLGVGFQGTHTCWIFVTFWNSISHHSCFLCRGFVGWGTKAEERHGVQLLFSFFFFFPLGLTSLPRHELLLSTQESCSGFRWTEHLKLWTKFSWKMKWSRCNKAVCPCGQDKGRAVKSPALEGLRCVIHWLCPCSGSGTDQCTDVFGP